MTYDTAPDVAESARLSIIPVAGLTLCLSLSIVVVGMNLRSLRTYSLSCGSVQIFRV
jgi:hypothetical protein